MDQCLMHPYFASQDNLAPRARLTSFVQPLGQVCIQDTLSSRAALGLPAAFRPSASREQRYLAYKGQVRARAKVSCIQFKTRQGNFRSARKEVVFILV